MKTSMINAINAIESMDEMNKVINLIKVKQKALRFGLCQDAAQNFLAGSKVIIESRKTGKEYGTVIKVNRTKAIVMIAGSKWNVPLTIMKAV